MRKQVLLIGAALMSSATTASDGLSMQQMLAVAKVTGACGMIRQALNLQEASKFEGGETFLTRLVATEAARFGKTSKEYIDDCNKATETYEALWKMAEEIDKNP